jgi:ABC-type transporter Mla subunit MlaD
VSNQQSNDSGRDRWLFLGSGLVVLTAVLVGLAREQHWGQPMVQLRLSGPNAGGLRPGQEVRISGLPVGKVQNLALQPDARVTIQLQVARRYASLIGPSSVATQGQEGFVGDRYLEITPDPQPNRNGPSLNNRTLRYTPPIAIEALMQQLVQTQDALQATLRNTHRLTGTDLPQTLREARRSLSGIHSLAATLERESSATAPDLRQTLRQITRTGSSAEQTSTQAQQLLRISQPLLVRTLEDLQHLSQSSRRLLQNLLGIAAMEDAPAKPPKP